MLIRLLIILIGLVGIVFIPYYFNRLCSLFIPDLDNEYDILSWMMGVALMILSSLIIIFIYFLIHYIIIG